MTISFRSSSASPFRKAAALFLFAVITVAVGIFILLDQQGTYEKTTGKIVEIETYWHTGADSDVEHDVYVTYTANGELFEHVLLGSYNVTMHEGDTIDLEFDVSRPGKVREPGTVVIPYILLGVGGAMLAGGVVVVVKESRKKAAERRGDAGNGAAPQNSDADFERRL